jgi:hypothetical protein
MFVSFVCCVLCGSATNRSLVHWSRTMHVCLILCDLETVKTRQLWQITLALKQTKKIFYFSVPLKQCPNISSFSEYLSVTHLWFPQTTCDYLHAVMSILHSSWAKLFCALFLKYMRRFEWFRQDLCRISEWKVNKSYQHKTIGMKLLSVFDTQGCYMKAIKAHNSSDYHAIMTMSNKYINLTH